MNSYLGSLKNQDLIKLFPQLLKQLKDRGIIRTNNLVGDLGETLAIK